MTRCFFFTLGTLLCWIFLTLLPSRLSAETVTDEMRMETAKTETVAGVTTSGGPTMSESPETFLVRDFGTVGDGLTFDTASIQKAIDACHDAGGGRVRFSRGTYLTGTIFLKTGVTLSLDEGATILGSPNPGDYRAFLIFAENAEKIGIEGKGTVNGNGHAFWDPNQRWGYAGVHWEGRVFPPDEKGNPQNRPNLIGFLRCRFITLRDFTIRDSPRFSVWPNRSEDILIHNLTILNPEYGPNTDGLDIDCCKRVRISDCDITGGDDAVALKSDSGLYGSDQFDTEDVVVTNCVLSGGTTSCGVRVGYEGDSVIRRCAFSNLTIRHCCMGIDIDGMLDGGRKIGCRVENVTFDNIVMFDVGNPLHFWLAIWNPGVTESQARIKNIRVSNLTAESTRGCQITGFDGKNAENITLSNIHLTLKGSPKPDAPTIQTPDWFGETPNALYTAFADGISIDRFKVDMTQAGDGWQTPFFFHRATDVRLDGISADYPDGKAPTALVKFDQSHGTILHSEPPEGAVLFETVNGSAVKIHGCELDNATDATTVDSSATNKEKNTDENGG